MISTLLSPILNERFNKSTSEVNFDITYVIYSVLQWKDSTVTLTQRYVHTVCVARRRFDSSLHATLISFQCRFKVSYGKNPTRWFLFTFLIGHNFNIFYCQQIWYIPFSSRDARKSPWRRGICTFSMSCKVPVRLTVHATLISLLHHTMFDWWRILDRLTLFFFF